MLYLQRKSDKKHVGVVLANAMLTDKGCVRSRVPTPPPREVLRGRQRTIHAVVNWLPVISSCQIHKCNDQTAPSRRGVLDSNVIFSWERMSPGRKTVYRPLAPRKLKRTGVLLFLGSFISKGKRPD